MLQQKLGVGDWLHVMMTVPRDRWSCAMLLRSYGRTCFFFEDGLLSRRGRLTDHCGAKIFSKEWNCQKVFRIFPSMCSLFLEDFCLEQTARETVKGSTWTWSMEHTKAPTRSGQTCVVALHLPRKIANEPLKQDEVFQLCTHIFDSMFMNV